MITLEWHLKSILEPFFEEWTREKECYTYFHQDYEPENTENRVGICCIAMNRARKLEDIFLS
jgi:hypothetical protein